MINHLELLIGPIASGKSTYARKRAAEGAVILNDDALVMALHAGNYKLYDVALKPLYKLLEQTIILAALAAGRDVVIDRPNHKRATRSRYIEIARSIDVATKCVLFTHSSPAVHAERRSNSDARGLSYETWLRVAQRHQAEAELLIPNEGFHSFAHAPAFEEPANV